MTTTDPMGDKAQQQVSSTANEQQQPIGLELEDQEDRNNGSSTTTTPVDMSHPQEQQQEASNGSHGGPVEPPAPFLPSSSSDSDGLNTTSPTNHQDAAVSTPPPPAPPSNEQLLEQRIQDLEMKLATLSLLLVQNTTKRRPQISPPQTPSPPNAYASSSSDEDGEHPNHNRTTGATPCLDSPAPSQRKLRRRQRNLSFTILHGGDTTTTTQTPTTSEELVFLQASPNRQSPSPPIPEQQQYDDSNQISKVRPTREPSALYLPLESELDNSAPAHKATTAVLQQQQQTKDIVLTPPPDILSSKEGGIDSVTPEILVDADIKSTTTKVVDTVQEPPPAALPDVSSPIPTKGKTAKLNKRMRSDSLTTATDVRTKWLDYLNSVQDSTHDVDKQMEEFVKVPSAVEALLGYGFWICVDSFLYVLTILPIRFVWSCILLVNYGLFHMWNRKGSYHNPYRFHRRHVYQLIQVSIIYFVVKFVLMPISIGKLYHWIRGQSMIKLYVLVAMAEIFDRLMCSLGQDCLDSLYWNTTRRPKSSRMAISSVVVLVYVSVHSFLLFGHVATLNVAMNSADQALLTLLISGNFAEIKSTVFKKYNKSNLFNITASDICERFKLALFLALVLLLNLSQGMDQPMIWSFLQMCGVVWCGEWLADWIKHAFITKLNFIPSSVYQEYGLLLAGDVTGFGHEGVNLDHSHAVVRRLGLAQIPMVCVFFRYVREASKYAQAANVVPLGGRRFHWQILALVWVMALAAKLFLGSFLHKISSSRLRSAPALVPSSSKTVGSSKKKTK